METSERIGVLAGGDSPEREVSLVSGEHVHRALAGRGYDAVLIRLETLDDLFPHLEGVDVAFNLLHGGAGEDGTVGLLLDVMGIPYAGSGAQACARAMDKPLSKQIFETMRVPTPPGFSLGEGDIDVFVSRVLDAFRGPYVVKPTNLGSTIGVVIVQAADELRVAVGDAAARYGDAMVEPFIRGRELTVGILGNGSEAVALPVIEIRSPTAIFDYRAKYTQGVAEFLVPADLSAETAQETQEVSVRAHEVLGCVGFSRVDLRLSEEEKPYVLEVNAIPGMTPMSDLPRAAAAAGIGYEDLVERMLATAKGGSQP